MELRSKICEKLGILYPLESFKKPPCIPPTGKDVLERIYGAMKNKKQNATSIKIATSKVACELIELWSFGDGRIPLLCVKSVLKNVSRFYEVFAFVRMESRKKKTQYASKVSNDLE